MNYLRQLFKGSATLIATTSKERRAPSPVDTAVCPTPNESRRIIRTIDGVELVVSADDIRHLEVLRQMFENLIILPAIRDPTILIPISIDSATLQKILDWSRANKASETNLDELFPRLQPKECLQILEASLFLAIPKLADCAARWIAAKLEGQTPPQMAQTLGRPYKGVHPKHKQHVQSLREVTMPPEKSIRVMSPVDF
ncbi:unnamed protein product [Caenorhabditis bovis]|uniref:SKP1 component POZ domain-containing protein n=1 Tax=Caenorhabditis bovis TaxID=2654633 RepID=A0A8S1EWX9_9PELO|nr:unnamed protein product [Caenorhabditis bovis]